MDPHRVRGAHRARARRHRRVPVQKPRRGGSGTNRRIITPRDEKNRGCYHRGDSREPDEKRRLERAFAFGVAGEERRRGGVPGEDDIDIAGERSGVADRAHELVARSVSEGAVPRGDDEDGDATGKGGRERGRGRVDAVADGIAAAEVGDVRPAAGPRGGGGGGAEREAEDDPGAREAAAGGRLKSISFWKSASVHLVSLRTTVSKLHFVQSDDEDPPRVVWTSAAGARISVRPRGLFVDSWTRSRVGGSRFDRARAPSTPPEGAARVPVARRPGSRAPVTRAPRPRSATHGVASRLAAHRPGRKKRRSAPRAHTNGEGEEGEERQDAVQGEGGQRRRRRRAPPRVRDRQAPGGHRVPQEDPEGGQERCGSARPRKKKRVRRGAQSIVNPSPPIPATAPPPP